MREIQEAKSGGLDVLLHRPNKQHGHGAWEWDVIMTGEGDEQCLFLIVGLTNTN